MPGLDPFSSLIGLGAGALSAGIGIGQHARGENILRNLHRPTYYIPGSQNGALNVAQSQYDDSSLPGQAGLENQLSANTAAGLTAAQQSSSSSGDVIDAITKLYKNQNQGNINLGIEAARNHLQNAMNLQNELGNQAQYEDKAFNYNINDPYQEKKQEGQSLVTAGNQNIAGGIGSALGVGASYAAAGGFKGSPGAPVGSEGDLQPISPVQSLAKQAVGPPDPYIQSLNQNYNF